MSRDQKHCRGIPHEHGGPCASGHGEAGHGRGALSEAAANVAVASAALQAATVDGRLEDAAWWAEVAADLVADLARTFSRADGRLAGHIKVFGHFGPGPEMRDAAHLYVSSVGCTRPPSVSGRLVGSSRAAWFRLNCLVYGVGEADAVAALQTAVARVARLRGLRLTSGVPSERVGRS